MINKLLLIDWIIIGATGFFALVFLSVVVIETFKVILSKIRTKANRRSPAELELTTFKNVAETTESGINLQKNRI